MSTIVQELTPKDFDGVRLRSGECCAVVFFHPSCGHCKEFLPIFRKVAARCGFLDFASFNCEVHSEALSRMSADAKGFKITGFPTTIFFSGGKPSESVVGKRNEGDFLGECMRVAEALACRKRKR